MITTPAEKATIRDSIKGSTSGRQHKSSISNMSLAEPISKQPSWTPGADASSPQPLKARIKRRMQHAVEKVSTREGWLGDYDFVWLCMPGLPWGRSTKRSKAPPFYALDADLPILLAIVVGFQHALAMVCLLYQN